MHGSFAQQQKKSSPDRHEKGGEKDWRREWIGALKTNYWLSVLAKCVLMLPAQGWEVLESFGVELRKVKSGEGRDPSRV